MNLWQAGLIHATQPPPASGGSSALTQIAAFTAVGGETGHDFTAIPQTFLALLLLGQVRVQESTGEDGDALRIRFNNDTQTDYRIGQHTHGRQGGIIRHSVASTTLRDFIYPVGVPGSDGDPGDMAQFAGIMVNYAGATNYKTWNSIAFHSWSSEHLTWWVGARWEGGVGPTALGPITTINVLPDVGEHFEAGSVLSLYGLGSV